MVAQRTRQSGFDEEPVEYTSIADLDEGLKTAFIRETSALERRLAGKVPMKRAPTQGNYCPEPIIFPSQACTPWDPTSGEFGGAPVAQSHESSSTYGGARNLDKFEADWSPSRHARRDSLHGSIEPSTPGCRAVHRASLNNSGEVLPIFPFRDSTNVPQHRSSTLKQIP